MADLNLHEVKECRKCAFTGPIHNGKTYNFLKDGTFKKDGTPRTRHDCASCYKGTRKRWETTIRQKVREYKAARCCEKCGRTRYWRLEFHHPDNNKEFSIGNVAGRMSWRRVLAEIKKCMLLCKICHCDIHHYEKHPEDEERYV